MMASFAGSHKAKEDVHDSEKPRNFFVLLALRAQVLLWLTGSLTGSVSSTNYERILLR